MESNRSPVISHQSSVIIRIAFCLLFFALCLAQLTTTSPTFDEGYTVLRGYAAWRTGHIVPIGHPPLAHWLSALGVILEPNLPDPRDLDGWYNDRYDDASRDLLWHRGLDATRIVFLGRFPILLLGLILGAVTARWANDLFGGRTALAALVLHALSPNLLANSAVATTDLPVAAFYVFTLYRWHRYSQTPTLFNAVLIGLMLGLALASKFNALLLLPTLGLFGLIEIARHRQQALRTVIHSAFIILPAAFASLWANYGFALNPYPLAQYVRELTDLTALVSGGHTAYLLGRLSPHGWWYYHLVVLAVKTPLPLLALLSVAVARLLRSAVRTRHSAFVLHHSSFVVPAALYLLATLTIFSLNVGYRYLLPALPLLHIFAASTVGVRDLRSGGWNFRSLFAASHLRQVAVLGLFGFQALSTLAIAPHFLAYFNELVGPPNGYRILVDSNLDWGQDLPGLAQYLNGRPVHLSYFGQAEPGYYGIEYEPLPAWPPRYGRVSDPPPHFAPADPAPGLYAISASNLVGVQLTDPNTFAYFRDLKPLAAINYSIFVYEVPQRKPVDAFAQCTPPILNNSEIEKLLGGRDVRQITFDCTDSILLPSTPSLLLYPVEQSPLIDRGASVFDWKRSDGTTYYRLYRTLDIGVQLIAPAPVSRGTYLTLLAYDLTPSSLTLHWLVEQPAPPPVSVFVHFNWPDGALAEAYDALGVPAEYWRSGDVIIQRHPISPDLPPGEYGVVVGLYSLADGTRYSEIKLTTYLKR